MGTLISSSPKICVAAMEALRASSVPYLHIPTSINKTHLKKPIFFNPQLNPTKPISSSPSIHRKFPNFTVFTATDTISAKPITPQDPEIESETQEEKFDWYSQWYPLMPVCDLDKRVPEAKRVMGLDVVVWWDRNESAWKVFDDLCPHRKAPLSEGRIDQWGRLQCTYHGWCFDGSGGCKFIPQAPPDGPLVNTFKKACVAVYPSTVQNGIVWFWPNTDPQYKDILMKQKPPYIPELDDPSYSNLMTNRDFPYGYEVMIENLMDPAHIPYAHYGIMQPPNQKKSVKADREGGTPMDMKVLEFGMNGFTGKQEFDRAKFFPPCVYCNCLNIAPAQGNVADQANNGSASSDGNKENPAPVAQQRVVLVFICVPVSPGKSRLIWAFPRNFAVWIDRVLPRWIFHVNQNLILDSDLYLLHEQEKKIKDIGFSNWQKACFVPTKSDAYVVGFRRWLNKYSAGQVDWRGKFSGELPPSPPREQLMDRYWSHVVNCSSCRAAHKGLNVLEVALQVIAIASVGIVAATKQGGAMPPAARTSLVVLAVLCFAASRWLSHFIYKIFHFHDYNHALR